MSIGDVRECLGLGRRQTREELRLLGILEIEGRTVPRTRSVAVQTDEPDPRGKLNPACSRNSQQIGRRAGALVVPTEPSYELARWIRARPEVAYYGESYRKRTGCSFSSVLRREVVYSVNESRVNKQTVSLGPTDDKNVEILKGLQEGVGVILNPRPDYLEGELINS